MKIMALNCGSSSLKYQVYDWSKKEVLASGLVERIGDASGADGALKQENGDGKEFKESKPCPDHIFAINWLIKVLTEGEAAVVKSFDEIKAVGHRIVHGGQKFNKSVEITDDVLHYLETQTYHLAPLHNPAGVAGIKAAKSLFKNVLHVAVFDTAFHQTMPAHAYTYAIPHEWTEKHGIRRYGMHGTSHLYVTKRAAKMLGKKENEVNLITLHIGNGASASAIKNGVCVDTSMGLTPLEGLVMGTRTGDMDPSVAFAMMDILKVQPKEMYDMLNKKSGLLGITGVTSDRRDIGTGKDSNPRYKLANDVEVYRIKKYIGSYLAALDGNVDAIVWTAGVGENATGIREEVCKGLEGIGIKMDYTKNGSTRSKQGESVLSTSDSKIKILMIPTNEELVFIEDVVAIMENKYSDHLSYNYTFKH